MMSIKTLSLLTAGALAVALSATSLAQAETMKITAKLDAASETPPTTSKGTGTLTGSYDTSSKKLTWDVTYSDLTGPATAAHFHAPAPVGKSSGVEIPIKGDVTSPIKGEMTLTDSDAKNLTDGMTYFNVHTAANKGGEIRGQVMVEK